MAGALSIRHPYDGCEYTKLADGTIRVADPKSGLEGVFKVKGGVWLSGSLKTADPMMLLFARDIARDVPLDGLAPGIRYK
jgi:hypothetical protein